MAPDTPIPPVIRALFDGRDLSAKTLASAILATVDDKGWPHLSFLSAGEILIHGDHLWLTLWATAHGAAALRRTGRGVLFAAAEGVVHELRLESLAPPPARDGGTVVIALHAVGHREHAAPYASVSGLIGFALDDPAASIDRWQRQIDLMRAAANGSDSGG